MAVHRLLEKPFTWVDVVNPSRDELKQLASEFRLHSTSVQDCLDPEHLPKVEHIGPVLFVIARGYDVSSGSEADTLLAMTRKVAVFMGDGFVLTVQRVEQPYLAEIKGQSEEIAKADSPDMTLLMRILTAVVESYETPLEQAEENIESFEVALFGNGRPASNSDVHGSLHKVHSVKRRLTVVKRMLWHTTSIAQRLHPGTERNAPLLQDLKEDAESYFTFADELVDDVTTLLSIQLSLASHRLTEASHQTNEVMRVLTLFSAFFMPLTFIVGVYGMNFRVMPEIQWHYGYFFAWLVMIGVTVVIYTWFRRKRWLGRGAAERSRS